jgi:holo-[acyl-carrier protein] synthase
MDIVGIGTEIVECLRVGRMIELHGEVFLAQVYTQREICFCQARRRATEHFAARWAAKEAVFKALGTPWRRGIVWTDIEIDQAGNNGVPQVLLGGSTKELAQNLRVAEVLLSLAHCRAYATAYAIAVRA